MGLDMYLTGEKYFMGSTGGRGSKKAELIDLGYWHKHPNLHGFIVEQFTDGIDECQRIELAADDLRQIIAAIEAGTLPGTIGPYFGKSDGSEKEEDLQIFNEAIKWLEEEEPDNWRSIYYQASW